MNLDKLGLFSLLVKNLGFSGTIFLPLKNLWVILFWLNGGLLGGLYIKCFGLESYLELFGVCVSRKLILIQYAINLKTFNTRTKHRKK